MDVSDFLIEYDLTPEQRALAARLKAQANLKQLVNTLGDHALFFCRQATARRCGSSKASSCQPQPETRVVNHSIRSSSSTQRELILHWFSSLDVAQRVALLTCDDVSWIRAVLRMRRLIGECDQQGSARRPKEWRFMVGCKPQVTQASRGRGNDRARAPFMASVANGKVIRDVAVHSRRPHRLPDGEWLMPIVSSAQRSADKALLQGLCISYGAPCSGSAVFEWGVLLPSPEFVKDTNSFVSAMDGVSLGRFLRDAPTDGGAAWAEAPWLAQWGSHYSLTAFLASRLEVLLLQGYAARNVQVPGSTGESVADTWSSMSHQARAVSLRRVNHRAFRAFLSDQWAILPANEPGTWKPSSNLASLLFDTAVGSWCHSKTWDVEAVARYPPSEFIGSLTTLSLKFCPPAADETAANVLSGFPILGIQKHAAAAIALCCSEHSARALLDVDETEKDAAAASAAKRREKKQRQKMRRKQAAEQSERERQATAQQAALSEFHGEGETLCPQLLGDAQQSDDVRPESVDSFATPQLRQPELEQVVESQAADPEATRQGPELQPESLTDPLQYDQQSTPDTHGPTESLGASSSAMSVSSVHDADGEETLPVPGLQFAALARGFIDNLPHHREPHTQMPGTASQDLDEFDGRASELSSSVGAMTRTSRSNSFVDGMVVSGHGYTSAAAALDRGSLPWEFVHCRRRPRRPSQRWHEDSRLEFLLRNRDRFATESECDRMSHCSHPASLDEGALYPVGLENRFSYLFDSPHSSRVNSTLASVAASQATADDDAERLGTQWDDFEEWRTLTEELEKTEHELQMWKAKAEELEEALTHSANRQVLRKDHAEAPGAVKTPPLAAKVVAATAGVAAAAMVSPVPQLRHQRSAGSDHRERAASDVTVEATAPAVFSWRYLVLLLLARRQLDVQQSPLCARHVARRPSEKVPVEASRLNAVVPTVERSFSMPRLETQADHALEVQVAVAGPRSPHRGGDRQVERDEQMHAERSPSPEASADSAMGFESWNPPQAQATSERTRRRAPLHVNFDARYKRNMSDSATQTAPAITLSNMFGSMMPRYRERELARLRQENHFLRMRVASLAMSQPLTRPPAVRHQSTQTAPAITQTVRSTSRQQATAKPAMPIGEDDQTISRLSMPENRLPSQVLSYFPQTPELSRQLTDRGGLTECVQTILEESLTAFVQAVEVQSQRQKSYRAAIHDRCQRAVQMLWPRSSVELYGSFASGLALPSSGLDLVIYPHRSDQSRDGFDYDRLPPIGEDGDTLRSSLDEVSPGHPSAVPSLSTGWQQQLSCRLAQEKFVLSDSIRITAHAAIPSLTFITTPEDAGVSPPPGQEEEPLPCPIRVDVSLEDPNHRGIRSKAIINWLLDEHPFARPVTLVLKQWLLERTFGMSPLFPQSFSCLV